MDASLIFSFVILSLAAILHGLTGMGFPLIATPTLAMTFSLSSAIALLAIPTLFLNALVVFSQNKNSSQNTNFDYLRHHYWLLALSCVIGSVMGVWLLLILPIAYLNLMMAGVILYYGIQGLLGMYGIISPLRVPTGKISMGVFGLLSGLIGGATNAMSPILLMYLLSKTDNKSEIAKASNLCYLLAKIVQIVLLWQEFARFDGYLWGLTAQISLVCFLGLMIGIRLQNFLSLQLFKQLIYLALFVIGIKVGWAGLSTIF